MTSHLIGMTLGYLFIENSLYVLCWSNTDYI
jgi:hypothetical protein